MACLQRFKEAGGFGPVSQEPPRPAAAAVVPMPPLLPQSEERPGHDWARAKFHLVPADLSESSHEEAGSDTQAYRDNDDDQDRVLLEVAATATGRYNRSQMQVFLVGVLPALPCNA